MVSSSMVHHEGHLQGDETPSSRLEGKKFDKEREGDVRARDTEADEESVHRQSPMDIDLSPRWR